MNNPAEIETRSFLESAPMAFDRTAGWNYIREAGEVFERDGQWYLTSPEAVRFAHQNPLIFSTAKAFDALGSPVPLVPVAIDPPDHLRYRRILDPMFAPRVINRIEDELRRQVREIIAQFSSSGSCDVMFDLAELYPTQVILTMLGLPLDDRDTFMGWTKIIVGGSAMPASVGEAERAEAGMALSMYLREYIVKKRSEPGHDILSEILALTGDDAWTDAEVLGMCFLFVLAGLDTVAASIGFVLRHLANDVELRRRVVADLSLVNAVVEEVLRVELPAPITPRVTTTEVVLCGVTIPAGAKVQLVLGTVNRENRACPHDVELSQAEGGHVSFGGGIHRCLGSHLARRELRLVVEEFLAAIPDFAIVENFVPRIQWPSVTYHLESLPITFPVVQDLEPAAAGR